MRIPVNYGEVNVGKDRIRVGVSLMSRTVGGLMLATVALLVVFIIVMGGGRYLFSTTSAQLWVLGGLIIYFSLRFMGAWSDSQTIDSAKQKITVTKHWLFYPYQRRVFPFKSIRSISWQEIVNQKVGAKQLDTRSTQVLFSLKDNAWLTIASISLANPDETLRTAEKLSQILSKFVHCPISAPVNPKVVIG